MGLAHRFRPVTELTFFFLLNPRSYCAYCQVHAHLNRTDLWALQVKRSCPAGDVLLSKSSHDTRVLWRWLVRPCATCPNEFKPTRREQRASCIVKHTIQISGGRHNQSMNGLLIYCFSIRNSLTLGRYFTTNEAFWPNNGNLLPQVV